MNMELFRLINNLANKNEALDWIMIFFSKYMPYIFVMVVGVVFILGVIKENSDYRKSVVSTFVITIINLALSFIVGHIYFEERPFVHNKVNLLLPHAEDASFPSDHSIGTMSIALGLKKHNKLLSRMFFVLSIIVGFSRVYVGNHYPMDVIGAYIVVFVANYIYNLKLRDKVENLYEIVEKKAAIRFGFKKLYNEA
ncbi:undecaprenyl-diphosphatase [Clostridium brassicae]|uniref:Undecaprenyl-diphosphatase n=1 Tax=Clostridium brassicae TaxID=2999072 RepID=A0ABT4DC41_9CLOT|nr:undecaprenyl-diphosphatase [Clostridium brassicae]MCY6959855.1 undecaprenyl-diphosphatase [Clostridium brassicae]